MPRRPLIVAVLALVTAAGCSGGDGDGSRSVDTTASTTTTTPPSSTTTTTIPGPPTQREESPLPAPVQESAAAVTSTGLYVAGGFDASRNSVATVSAFDGTAWSSAPSLPTPLNHPAAAAIGDDVYVAGGFFEGTATNRSFVLHPGATSWTELAPLTVARGAAALVNVDGALYLLGGNSGQTQIADVERFDSVAQTWTVVAQLPHPRNHLAGFVEAGKACAAGGREPATSAAIDCLDPATTTWTSDALPTPTSGAAAGVLHSVLLVAGGEPSGETSITPDVQQRGVSAVPGWTTQPMLVPRHGTGFAMFHDRLWMCGGGTEPGYAATAVCTSIGSAA